MPGRRRCPIPRHIRTCTAASLAASGAANTTLNLGYSFHVMGLGQVTLRAAVLMYRTLDRVARPGTQEMGLILYIGVFSV